MKMLVLEDEMSIRSFVTLNFKREGFDVLESDTGISAIKIFDENPDIQLAVLDVMLPDIDGFEVLKYIRSKNKNVGIIMLTARTHEQDKVMGLEYGADDYIGKPFSPAELIARVRSLIRRLSIKDDHTNIILSGKFKLDVGNRKFFRDDVEIELTPKEFEMLQLFLTNRHKSLSRDYILNQVWGDNYFGDLKVVDVNIRRIRKKIEEDAANPSYLKTIWGYGYRWEDE